MSFPDTPISRKEIQGQLEICARIRALHHKDKPLAMVNTYGCQQNEADSEKIRGLLREMGYGFTKDEFSADVIVVNTCAIRERAEMRILGNLGALTHTKRKNKDQLLVLCGCMVQQKHMQEKIKNSYGHVDLVFGPHALWRFPEFMLHLLTEKGRLFEADPDDGAIAEGLPVARDGEVKAWLSIMYGCNNFCSYCVVPYVRGRERSREPETILAEARELIDRGYKDITLLGQNVNSYGGGLGEPLDFAGLIRRINDLPGDFLIRFMTSHPKDANLRLFETMAQCEKCARHIHLPVQAGNDRVLQAMNRGYTAGQYLALLEKARSLMPGLVVTSDIIVGFPGETDREFEDTLALVERVGFDALFTFIFSSRKGTPAARMEDPFSREQKQRRFDRLVQLQNSISEKKHAAYVGSSQRLLVDGINDQGEYKLAARTNGGRLVHLKGDPRYLGHFVEGNITGSGTWALFGEIPDQ